MDIDALMMSGALERAAKTTPEFGRDRALLIPLLHRLQDELGYLAPEVLQALARRLSIPLAEVYGVASFYDQFHFSPRGRTVVKVCTGTACHVKGASDVLSVLQDPGGSRRYHPGSGHDLGNGELHRVLRVGSRHLHQQ